MTEVATWRGSAGVGADPDGDSWAHRELVEVLLTTVPHRANLANARLTRGRREGMPGTGEGLLGCTGLARLG